MCGSESVSARRTIYAKVAPFNRFIDAAPAKRGKPWVPGEIEPGAFARAIAGGLVRLTLGHGGPVIARQADGSLELREESSGLFAAAKVPAELAARVEAGEFTGIAIGFAKPGDLDAGVDQWNGHLRQLRLVDLQTVALVRRPNQPAYPGTWVKTLEQYRAERGTR